MNLKERIENCRENWYAKNQLPKINYSQEDLIKELLIGRRVVNVKDDTLVLDNGTELTILPNEGCSGCGSGWYGIKELNKVNNAIMDVEFDVDYVDDFDSWVDTSYKIFVYANNVKEKLLQVDGTDGNGYYGTGYRIKVKFAD